MSDRFEETVRQAAQGLGAGGAEAPSYEHAWRRGRRRRYVKRGALAVAGAAVLAVALSVNLDLPGSEPIEGDVAAPITVATAEPPATPISTTAPVETPTVEQALVEPSAQATADEAASSTAPTAVVETPTVTPDPVATALPTQSTAPTPTIEAVVPVTPSPTVTPTTVPSPSFVEPTATPNPAAFETTAPSDTTSADTTPSSQTPDEQAPGETGPGDAASTGPAVDEPSVAATTSPDKPADAVLIDAVPAGTAVRSFGGLPCDLDGDKSADATCELMPDYQCQAGQAVAPGYEAVDLDGDGAADTCIATGVTVCDTTGDGIGDTPCTIELDGVIPEDPDDPES